MQAIASHASLSSLSWLLEEALLEEAGSTTNVYYLNFNFRSTTNKCELPTYVFIYIYSCVQLQTGRQINRHTGRQIRWADRQAETETDNKHTKRNKRTDRQRQNNRQACRQRNRYKQTDTPINRER